MNTRKLIISSLILGCVLLAACAPAPTSTPAAIALPATPTVRPPAATSVPTLAETTVSPKIFKIPLSVTFGPDWRYNGSSPETIELLYRPSNLYIDFIIVDNVTLFISGDPTTHIPFPDDFAGYLRSNDYFSEVTPNTPVTLGGANGYQVDAVGISSSPNRAAFLSVDDSNFKEFIGSEAQKYRFIYMGGISGKQLLIIIASDVENTDVSPTVNPLSVTQFDSMMSKVQEVLDTVVFSKP